MHGNTVAGQFADAIAAFHQARELNPKHPYVATRLAEAERQQQAAGATPPATLPSPMKQRIREATNNRVDTVQSQRDGKTRGHSHDLGILCGTSGQGPLQARRRLWLKHPVYPESSWSVPRCCRRRLAPRSSGTAGVVCRAVGSQTVSEHGQPSAFQVKGPPATAHGARRSWTTEEIGLVPTCAPQVIAWDKAAALLTFSLTPALLAATAHAVPPE